jgi:hypothetical protein
MIRLKSLLTEAININGVTLRAINTQSGGPVEASWDGNSVQYKVELNSLFYSGAVGITAIYKKDGEYFVLTNQDQKEELSLDKLNKLVNAIKSGDSEIELKAKLGSTITFIKKS